MTNKERIELLENMTEDNMEKTKERLIASLNRASRGAEKQAENAALAEAIKEVITVAEAFVTIDDLRELEPETFADLSVQKIAAQTKVLIEAGVLKKGVKNGKVAYALIDLVEEEEEELE